MLNLFINIRIFDIIDIILVAFLLYKLYNLIKGTAAFSIFIGIFSVYVLWLIVQTLNMKLLGNILGQIIGVGVIALLIVFQQEIRKFLLYIGNQYFSGNQNFLNNIFNINLSRQSRVKIKSIVKACINMTSTKTGALIVIAKNSELDIFAKTGDILNSETSSRLIETIFSKNSPLHDGAAIIVEDKIKAARCVLPISENPSLPAHFGLRHRAGIGISEETDAMVIIVSEERGSVSVAQNGKIIANIDSKELMISLEKEFSGTKK
jgi:uncharacterized protein (TIGR00159 family)